MAAYVLTDRAVIDELREAAERGVKVRIWRDASEAARLSDFDGEAQLGGQVQGLEIRSNAPGGELMHLKGYCELHMALREALDREASPTAAILDSQSLKAAEGGATSWSEKNAVGYDAGKKGKGHKIHALVDVEGLPLHVIVHSAGIQDRDGAVLVLDKIRQRFPWLELIWADAGYNAHQVKDAVARSPGLRLEIVKRTDDIKGFVVLPRRSVVERTFSWFGRNRRLAKDYQNLAETLAAFVTLAAIQFAIRRLARM